ncbi:glycosyltransferase 87 family protein [Propionicicella superfundia]|uniref:glycosyltransferase 87 family protein n=1 Tax=Propionicicella superfundia TaxID=348582 RepID=UPI00146CF578|nr:glycosyltransferase 87 family protein [Propionicicella superfundia]
MTLDRGIFVSVAERLLAGDVLYRDVWDNKDPLFYYTIALGRAVSPLMDIVLEMAWVALTGVGVALIARFLGARLRMCVVAGFVMTPLVLTGPLYFPGNSHLPAVAVATLSVALALQERYLPAGVLVAVTFFLKLVVTPALILPLVVIVAVRRQWRGLAWGALGALLGGGVMVAVLVVRQELVPYLGMLSANVGYSSSVLLNSSLPAPLAHFARLRTPAYGILAAALILTVVLGAVRWRRARAGVTGVFSLVTLSVIAAVVAATAVLAVTGLWVQHLLIYGFAAALAAALLAALVDERLGSRPLASLAVLVVAAVLLAGGPLAAIYPTLPPDKAIRMLTSTPREAQVILQTGEPASYARLGSNDDRGHAVGLGAWHLACPRFHQYRFDSQSSLDTVTRCLPKADVVYVSTSFAPKTSSLGGSSVWNPWVARTEQVLRADFTCAALDDGARICVRKERS